MLNMVAPRPPPIIAVAKVVAYANVEDLTFIGGITLCARDGEPLGAVPRLAIARKCCAPEDILLEFCDSDWNVLAVMAVASVEEAKRKAEGGYPGVRSRWTVSEYSDAEIDEFLRAVYDVDPRTEWWTGICPFCRTDVVGGSLFAKGGATICGRCVETFCRTLQEGAME
jgi:hypothetical protein